MRRVIVPYATVLLMLFSVITITAEANSLDARWRMDDNADNATVIANLSDLNGTLNSGSSPMNTNLAHNTDASEGTGSLAFDGVDDYIQVYGYKGIAGTASRTCTAWIKTTASQQGAIVCWGTSASSQKWIFRVEPGGALGVGIYGGSIKTVATPLGDNTWHHVGVVLNDDGSPNVNEILLYIDGVQQITTASSAAINTGSVQDVMIGAHREDIAGGGTPNMYFKGQLDDIHIYNYSLSADEILEIKNWGPSPARNAVKVASDSELSWIAQSSALSYDVYLGTNQSAVASAQRLLGDINGDGPADITDLSILASQWLTNGSADIVDNGIVDIDDFAALAIDWSQPPAAAFMCNQTGTSFDSGTLEYNTAYYWRIDKVDASGTTTGPIWNFSTLKEIASDPSPANGTTNILIDTDLSWTPGVGANYHKLYFGTDPTPDSAEYIDDFTEPTYDPGLLNYNTTYYWRVDEVNAGGTTTGTVWSFTTSDRLLPEEFSIIPWSGPYRGWGPLDSQQTFSELYDCGFNVADFVADETGLWIAAANNLKAIIADGSGLHVDDSDYDEYLTPSSIDYNVTQAVNKYSDNPGLFGYYLRDEPGADLFNTLGAYVSAFRIADPDHLAYINLFPNYANADQMDVPTYQQYVDSYVFTVQPDYISYDHYGLNSDLTVDSAYWSNLSTIRNAALNNNIPFWNIVCSVKSPNWPTPSSATLRFQVYASLAYGVKGIGWFVYFNINDSAYSLAPINLDGSKTATWYYLRDVNLQIHKIGPTYLTLSNVGVYHSSSPSGWSISGSDLLVGDFDQIGTGQSFVMVVNKSLTSTRNYTASESLPGSVYYVSPTDGQFYPLSGTLTLLPGEGRLLTVQ